MTHPKLFNILYDMHFCVQLGIHMSHYYCIPIFNDGRVFKIHEFHYFGQLLGVINANAQNQTTQHNSTYHKKPLVYLGLCNHISSIFIKICFVHNKMY